MDRRGTVVITGAAGGIGRATASALLDQGFRVVGADIDEGVLRPPPEVGPDPQYQGLVVDITDEQDLDALRADLARAGTVEHLILAAGGSHPGEIRPQDPLDVPTEIFTASVHLNLTAQYLTVRHLLPTMGSGGHGDRSITFVSSINAIGSFGAPAYAAGKAGLGGLVTSLTLPLGRRRIRVNAVAFGTVRTPNAEARHAHEPERQAALTSLSALDRTMDADDAASSLVAVITHLRTVTGTVLTVDGGQSLPGRRDVPRPSEPLE